MSATRPAERRVVITGMGVVCPLGVTKESLWDGLLSGRSGVAPWNNSLATVYPMPSAAEAREFTGAIDDFGPLEAEQKKAIRKGLKTICRDAQMGIAAAQRAIRDAGLSAGKFDPERTGSVFGSDYMISTIDEVTDAMKACIDEDRRFQFSQWGGNGMTKMNPLWLLKYLPNMPAAHLAIYNDLRGPNNSITVREASANQAIGEAFRYVARGAADCMVSGSTGTYVHVTKMMHAVLQQEVSNNGRPPAEASRPFDAGRNGMIPGEGAGAIVMEELQTARNRGATIYAEIVGVASSSVADRNFIADRERALTLVMQNALGDAHAVPGEIGHIHAHGLSARRCDAEEARAIHAVFGPKSVQPPVVAAKSHFGNLGAGSGAVELIGSVMALMHGKLFPVLNYETHDPACDVNVNTRAGASPGGSFLNANVTQQGHASCLMVKAFG